MTRQDSGTIRVAVRRVLPGIATAWLLASWPLTSDSPGWLMALAAIGLGIATLALMSRSGRLPGLAAGPLLRRDVSLRRKSWGAAFQRQLNPDAAGHARPRAPSAAPAAA